MTHRLAPAAVAAAVLAAGAAFAGAPAPASGAALGVQDDVLSSAPIERLGPRLELIERSGAKVTRFDVLWSLVETRRPRNPGDPADPAYSWDRIDFIMAGLAERGIVPLVTVYSAPSWAAGGRGAPPDSEVNPHAPDPLAFGRFMQALATRYSGRYVPPGGTTPLPAINHIEVWNEPNLQGFLAPQFRSGVAVGLRRYVAMVNAAYGRIKRANPRATVIAGVGGPRSSTSVTGMGALPWLHGVARSGARFDAYSQHVYPAVEPLRPTRAVPSWSTVQTLIDALDRVPRHRGKSLYITEAGYTTAATPYRTVRVNPSQQAAYLRHIVSLPVLRSPRVPLVVWFNLQDNRFWPGGLRDERGREKPSWDVFVPLARASRVPAELRGAGRAGGGRVAATARQLLINQRISQAAVRRSNAVQAYLDAGLTGADVRPGALGHRSIGPEVTLAGTPTGMAPAPLGRARLETAPSSRRGNAAGIRVSAAQILINQRISQAAVRRSNGLTARLGGGLTGGDVRDGSIGGRELDPGLTVSAVTPVGVAQRPSETEVAPASRSGGGRVSVTAAQLRINQRIAQAAVRRSNALLTVLAEGLTEENFRPDTIGAADLAPALVPPPAP